MSRPSSLQLSAALIVVTVFASTAPLEAQSRCTFNGKPRECEINQGHRIPLTPGSDLDVKWKDGEVTTVKYLDSGSVLINGKTSGRIRSSVKVGVGAYRLEIRSATGNWFTVVVAD